MKILLKNHSLALAMLCGTVVAVLIAAFNAFADECERIPEGVLRLHIIAESDSAEDQDFKLELRDYILANFAHELQGCDTLESAVAVGTELLPQIQAAAQGFAYESGYDKAITAEITEMYFTTRKYENVTLPAGNYTALRITIGAGEGENWWCVMFPLLCLPACSESQAAPVINLPETNSDNPRIKFAIFELMTGLFR
ncbi:MAG: stage II sporulation protein R [Oscillospiraceae bacterium]|nr:stage II sporulation protein R [Oscillospiraceae bacterium]